MPTDPATEAAETLAALRYIHPQQAQDVAGIIALAYARAARPFPGHPRKEVDTPLDFTPVQE